MIGISTQKWVAVHRKHHATVETTDDPHSSQVTEIKQVIFDGLPLYQWEAKDQKIIED
jgi:stearoyl-CoA desaturase (delta-9 desaturase)